MLRSKSRSKSYVTFRFSCFSFSSVTSLLISRSGYVEFGQKKHSSFLLRTISGSKFCRGDALASQVDKQALVPVDRNSVSLSENRIVKAAMMQKQLSNLEEELKNTKARLDEAETERNRVIAELRGVKERVFSELKSLEDSLSNSKMEIESRDNEIRLLSNQLESAKVFEVKLGERDASLDELKKRNLELEDQVEKTKRSESNLLESLMLQTGQIEQAKIDLEESRIEVKNLQKVSENNGNNLSSSLETKTLKDEIEMLKNEVKLAMEAEEKSKKAMDDLALALREVATEASKAKEKLKSSEEQATHNTHLKEEIKQLKEELGLQTDTSERLRLEAEESILAWTAKELGFISCIRKSDEENASLKQENSKLNEALEAAENTTRITREENSKLRDILKQARAENSELEDLLSEKEESLPVHTKENERLRISEVEAHKEQTDVFISPVSSLYEDHFGGRTTSQRMSSFDFDDMKMFKKQEVDPSETVANEASEKAEALPESISDSNASPRLEPQKPQMKDASGLGYADSSGSGRFEDADQGSNGDHTEDGEDKGFYMYGLYNRKKLFRKIEELIVGRTNSKKEGFIDQGKEQSNGQAN
ncbi:hypothetical protein SSX86_007944 [Deinandra increscens subsp. villosa]|uniref:Uncharacterized protein n=1 Tax=Deinandra increscens subsp. villosa TaxID=3103831 RepID=A0AAP0H8E8_9ASTR